MGAHESHTPLLRRRACRLRSNPKDRISGLNNTNPAPNGQVKFGEEKGINGQSRLRFLQQCRSGNAFGKSPDSHR